MNNKNTVADLNIELTKYCSENVEGQSWKQTVAIKIEETVDYWVELFINKAPDERAEFMLGVIAEHKQMGCPMANRDDLHPIPRLEIPDGYKLKLKKVMRDIWSKRETEKMIKSYMKLDLRKLKKANYKAMEAYEIIAKKYNWQVQSVKNEFKYKEI